jgi:hypothetical protein
MQTKEHFLQIAANRWIISSPIDFPTTLICLKFLIAIKSSSTITVPAGCQINLKSNIIQLDSTTTDSDLETIHYKWSWDSNVLFLMYQTDAFESTIFHLKNLTAISINNINIAVEKAMAMTQSDNKTVQDYFKDLEQIKNNNLEHSASTNKVFIILLTLISLQSCYCVFKICFTPTHNINPLFLTYKLRECTKRSRKHRNKSGSDTYTT